MTPCAIENLDLGRQYPVSRFIQDQKDRYFENARLRQRNRALNRVYDRDWGDAIVDQDLADDPPPINGGLFHPIKRWIVVYRTAEPGVDGTHNITISDFRNAISTATQFPQPFILRKLHIWLAPNAVNTHFSAPLS